MDTTDWLPLLGVVIGWLLNQSGQWFSTRREEKRAVARALSALLEIRHRMLAIPQAAEYLIKNFPVPPEAHAPIKVVLAQFFPPDANLTKRYGEAIDLVAASNPILGFRLMSQDAVAPLLDHMRALSLADAPSTAIMAKLEPELLQVYTPHLENLIKELAWRHGFATRFRVGRALNRRFELPATLLESMKSTIPATPPSDESGKVAVSGASPGPAR